MSSCRTVVGPNNKNSPKKLFIKFVKLTGSTNACNSLTNFESEVRVMTENGNQVNLLKLASGKIREITSSDLITGGF